MATAFGQPVGCGSMMLEVAPVDRQPGNDGSGRMTAVAVAGWACVAGIYIVAALARPFCSSTDEAVYVNLARALRHGSYSSWEPGGAPITDPLPGFSVLLALPVWIIEPHWQTCWILGLAPSLAVVYLTRRLAERLLPPRPAMVATLLTVFNPVLLEQSGLLLPDVTYLALSVALLMELSSVETRPRLGFMILAAGCAALIRPHGTLLIGSLMLGVGAKKGWRAAILVFLAANVPLCLWLLRNYVTTGVLTGYGEKWSAEPGVALGIGDWLVHVDHVMGALVGEGVMGLAQGWPRIRTLGWMLTGMAAGWGAARLWHARERPLATVLMIYVTALLALHVSWQAVTPRYAIPLIPLLWILALRGTWDCQGITRAAGRLALILVAASMLWKDLHLVNRGIRSEPVADPRTMAWIKHSTDPGSRFMSFECPTLKLLAERETLCPPLTEERDSFIAALLRAGVNYVHVFSFRADGFFPDYARRLADHQQPWMLSSPYFREVYRNRDERTLIYRLVHPAPQRYLMAWAAYEEAAFVLRARADRSRARQKAREAVSLEPRLAQAWALLAGLEEAPRERLALWKRAAEADRADARIRSEIRRLGSQ